MSTPTERVEAASHDSEGGWSVVDTSFARTLAGELEAAQAREMRREEQLSDKKNEVREKFQQLHETKTQLAEAQAKITELEARIQDFQQQLTNEKFFSALNDKLAQSESGAAALRNLLKRIAKTIKHIEADDFLSDIVEHGDAIKSLLASTTAGKSFVPREVLEMCRDALQSLRDHQNGPPLYRHEDAWNESMGRAQEALNAASAALEGRS